MVQTPRKVAVIGGSAAGSHIAAVCVLAGFDVNVQDIHEKTFEKNMEGISKRLQYEVGKDKISWKKLDDSFAHLFFEPELESAVKDRDFVIEAMTENLAAKTDMFKTIDAYAPGHAIFATNSSTLVSSKIADATGRPSQVCNLSIFNPAETVQGPHTSDETAEAVMDVARRLNNTSILLQEDNDRIIVES
ncbi:hypothetical protein HUG15_13050 [Salicibibacter cibarius]|uniref:3-hydroxyacyl-CoA dehydrogenase NAD binding domain-containing protein n=1 Tax=Salicibibacter cibarius TaxID=2743000 RepID=A0A7T6Z3L0_9BACI|nr:3-hydroxyacyl-CoA dehydrogenase NAD-binding domain-containing protein [Salicibibacter cibarius]QQK76395.1 hypothetical protein HUG15_13050 [Salicibibacter cibarius]